MNTYVITHFYHSGFSVSCGDTLLIFDYWRGENGELDNAFQLTPEDLAAYARVFVFISHEHVDHLDPIVFTWKDHPGISYIVSSDMPVGTRGRRMAPGDTLDLTDQIHVTACDSTDLGVSFHVDFMGLKIFHAGDLNFWHWREESTLAEIDEADIAYRTALKSLDGLYVDLAFFPVDPRQGTMFEAGANYFILTVKPRILIPMHYFHRADVAMEYARTASCRTTEVVALPGIFDQLFLSVDEEGYLNLSFPDIQHPKPSEKAVQPEIPANAEDVMLSEDDPFLESDLPLSQLAEEKKDEDPPTH